jgi:hypothetical protein
MKVICTYSNREAVGIKGMKHEKDSESKGAGIRFLQYLSQASNFNYVKINAIYVTEKSKTDCFFNMLRPLRYTSKRSFGSYLEFHFIRHSLFRENQEQSKIFTAIDRTYGLVKHKAITWQQNFDNLSLELFIFKPFQN